MPIIMLTGHGERWRWSPRLRPASDEFLVKPVSAQTLRSRMVSIFAKPRGNMQVGNYYGPAPRIIDRSAVARCARHAHGRRSGRLTLVPAFSNDWRVRARSVYRRSG